jgi:malate dehydrogenase (oxaloacetate-decarboxylating)
MTQASDPIEFHRQSRGKTTITSKVPLDAQNLSIVYTPGVGQVSMAIAGDPALVRELTGKQNTVAIVTDGTAVLGLGDIGPEAALPVMEGKAAIFSEFAGISAVPICLDTKDPDAIVETVKYIAPGFGGINLEDISAPRCFEIERRLTRELDIPVFHDDQHGTAIVVLAGLINALAVAGKDADVRIGICGAGAAGIAIAQLLVAYGLTTIRISDSKGVLTTGRETLNDDQREVLALSTADGSWPVGATVLDDADVFIGVSRAGLFTADDIRRMRENPIVFALANPVPEIMPDEARAGGAVVVATGRSDLPNQINNALVFPGLFRGLLDHAIAHVTVPIKLAVAAALAGLVEEPTPDAIVPSIFDGRVVPAIARAVGESVA